MFQNAAGYRPIYDATEPGTAESAKRRPCLEKPIWMNLQWGLPAKPLASAEKNPHNPDRVAGGSSGGVASAVGAGLPSYGLGSDTGGSIRQHRKLLRDYRLKAYLAPVSRYGLIAYASSLDPDRPHYDWRRRLTALVYDAISVPTAGTPLPKKGRRSRPPHAEKRYPWLKNRDSGRTFLSIRTDVADAVTRRSRRFPFAGRQRRNPSECPRFQYALPVYYVTGLREASSNLRRYDGIRYGISSTALRRDTRNDVQNSQRRFRQGSPAPYFLLGTTS